MDNNFDNCLYIGTIEDLNNVCLANEKLTAADFKSIKLPRYRSFDIKLLKENKMYYAYVHGDEIAVAKIDKLDKRILKTFEVFVYKNDEPIKSFDIQIKKPSEVMFLINNQLAGSLVVCKHFHDNAVL
jgi:hypothetical protein